MAFKTRKAAIIGTGHVGSHCAWALALLGICDELLLIDINQPKALAQATDLTDAGSYLPHRLEVRTGTVADCGDADLAVICAGTPPDPRGPRADMTASNIAAVKTICGPLKASGFDGIVINISNPCDVVTRYIQRTTGFPASRVIGTSTALDSARLCRVLSERLGVNQKSIRACVMGEHGESQMVPWSNVTVGGKPLIDLMNEYPDTIGRLDLSGIAETVRRSGWVVLEGKGSTEFSIAATLAEIVRAIFHNEHRVLPVSTLLRGEYGQREVYAGVPAVLGAHGVERVIEVPLNHEEHLDFDASCEALRGFYQEAAGLS